MTPELERIGKILLDEEGGCWHEVNLNDWSICNKCGIETHWDNVESITNQNPDFSQWSEFGRLRDIAKKILDDVGDLLICNQITFKNNTDQIPLLVSTELARIIKEKNDLCKMWRE
jgi:hypothetical protein